MAAVFFFKLISTNKQIEELIAEAINAGVVDTLGKGNALIKFFSAKGIRLSLLLRYSLHTESRKVKGNFELLKLYREDSSNGALIEKEVAKENIFILHGFELGYHIRPRSMDTLLGTTKISERAFSMNVSQYAITKKGWFFDRYDVRSLLVGIATRLVQEELLNKFDGNGVVWVMGNDEQDELDVRSRKYWIAFTLTSYRYKKEDYFALLLDNVHHDRMDNEILSLAKRAGEVFLDWNMALKKKEVAKKCGLEKKGLTIVKKAHK